MMKALIENINFRDGLVPAVIVDEDSGAVLTLCYLDRAALQKSFETGLVHLFRRSKGRLMKKGESSGHTQEISEVRIDCSGNSLLIYVRQNVAACHEGYFSCFFRRYDPEKDRMEVIEEKLFEPDTVYRTV